MPRLACLYIPEFSLAARVRSDPSLREQAVVLMDGKGSHAFVLGAAPLALTAGVRPGFSLPQARALLPGAVVKARDMEAESAAQAALLETAEAFSPRVEEAEPGVVYLHMCNERSESMLVELAVRRARLSGLRIRAAVAGGKIAARVAAEAAVDGPIVIPPGEEAAYLAPLPLARMRPSPPVLEMLTRWGLRTAGAFASLPERDVIARLGREGWDLHRAARGVEDRPLVPRAYAPLYEEGVEFDWPLLDLGVFTEVSRGLLERLCARLAASDLAVLTLRFTLKLDPTGVDARSLQLPAPTRNIGSILSLLALELEKTPPVEPVVGIRLSTRPERPRRAQLSLFDPPVLSPDALNDALTRLSALVGPDRVGSPRTVAGHRPESYAVEPFAPPHPENRTLFEERSAVPAPALISIRTLRPRIELDVTIARTPEGAPAGVRSRHMDGTRPEIVGTVRIASGPWRIEEGWWMGEPVMRDYWDIDLSDGALYRIYHDPVRNAWYADGIYD